VTIELQINGRAVRLDGDTELVRYLDLIGVEPRAVAVELNGVILERAQFSQTVLRGGDQVEIVRMVGGGSAST
jgi:sulfur carrier protein